MNLLILLSAFQNRTVFTLGPSFDPNALNTPLLKAKGPFEPNVKRWALYRIRTRWNLLSGYPEQGVLQA